MKFYLVSYTYLLRVMVVCKTDLYCFGDFTVCLYIHKGVILKYLLIRIPYFECFYYYYLFGCIGVFLYWCVTLLVCYFIGVFLCRCVTLLVCFFTGVLLYLSFFIVVFFHYSCFSSFVCHFIGVMLYCCVYLLVCFYHGMLLNWCVSLFIVTQCKFLNAMMLI